MAENNPTIEDLKAPLLAAVGAHVPPPAGLASPMLWGCEHHLRGLLGEGICSLEITTSPVPAAAAR